MSAALAGPVLAAAALLCVSGAAKLRAPTTTREALATLGVVMPTGAVRCLAALECLLGIAVVDLSGRALLAVLAVVYVAFAIVTLSLRRARAACGCFGDRGAPATVAGAALSGALAALTGAAALAGPHGLGWVLAEPLPTAGAVLIGAGGCVLALVLAYTELPAAWSAWTVR